MAAHTLAAHVRTSTLCPAPPVAIFPQGSYRVTVLLWYPLKTTVHLGNHLEDNVYTYLWQRRTRDCVHSPGCVTTLSVITSLHPVILQ